MKSFDWSSELLLILQGGWDPVSGFDFDYLENQYIEKSGHKIYIDLLSVPGSCDHLGLWMLMSCRASTAPTVTLGSSVALSPVMLNVLACGEVFVDRIVN